MKKSHFVLLIVSLLLVVIAIGAVHVIKLVLFTPYVKDNSVVESDYEGWKKVELDSDCSFCIPKDWKIKRSEDRISIVDSSGKIVSVGKKFYIHTEDDLKKQVQMFMWDVLDCEPVSSTSQSASSNMFGNGAAVYFRELVLQDNTVEKHLTLTLPNDYEYEYIFVFCDEADDAMHEYAEAMAVSFRQK